MTLGIHCACCVLCVNGSVLDPLCLCMIHMYTTQGVGGGGSLDSDPYSTSPHTKSLPQPIGRPERTGSTSSDSFQRAVGAEVKSKSLEDEGQVLYSSDI